LGILKVLAIHFKQFTQKMSLVEAYGGLYGTYDDCLYGNPWGMFDSFPEDVSDSTYEIMERAVEAETETARSEQDEHQKSDDFDYYIEVVLYSKKDFFELCDARFDGNIDSCEAHIRSRYEAWYQAYKKTKTEALKCRQLLAEAHISLIEELKVNLESLQNENSEVIQGAQRFLQHFEELSSKTSQEAAEYKNKTDSELNSLESSKENVSGFITNFCNECRDVRNNQ
jgi:hypothetical protein